MNDEKKQIPLRLSKRLYEKLAKWADEDFRSINGQIEYILHLCVEKKYCKDEKETEKEKEI